MGRSKRIPGDKNRNKQVLIVKTELPGNDHNQYLWVVRCENVPGPSDDLCLNIYGVNGSDFHHRLCPRCWQNAAKGLPVPSSVLDRIS